MRFYNITMDFSIIRWITFILLILFQVIYLQAGIILFRERMQRRSWKEFIFLNIIDLIMIFFILGTLIVDLLICIDTLKPFTAFNNYVIIIIGFVLFIVGFAGTMISRFGFLKGSWSSLIKVFPEKNLVCHGPYRIIRHPIYFFSLFFFIGTLFLFPTMLNSIIISGILVGYIILTKVEDDYLQTRLEFYRKYAQVVLYRLIPGIW